MKRRGTLILMLAWLFPLMLNAQLNTEISYKNSVKLNTVGLILHNASIIYERNLNSHWAVLAGAGYRWGGDLPKLFGLGDLVVSSKSGGLRGYNITPELRYYFNFCECGGSPSGLYAGLYTRLSGYEGDLRFHYWNGTEYIDAGVATNFREMGGGIQIGYQFIFKERFMVDFMFAGPRLTRDKIGFTIDSDYMEDLIPIIEEEINKRLEWLGKDPITIYPSTEIEAKFGFKNFRYGIAIGILF